MGPPYTHSNAASHQDVCAREHAHTGSDHVDSNGAAFCDADRCHGYGHRYGDARDGDERAADSDECVADSHPYTVGHTDSDERTAD